MDEPFYNRLQRHITEARADAAIAIMDGSPHYARMRRHDADLMTTLLRSIEDAHGFRYQDSGVRGEEVGAPLREWFNDGRVLDFDRSRHDRQRSVRVGDGSD